MITDQDIHNALAAQGACRSNREVRAVRLLLNGLNSGNVFQQDDFTLHSGSKSFWKLNCDAFIDQDWATLARIIGRRLAFQAVEGVPRGGLRLAEQLERYRRSEGGLLIVDDVLTTGASMEQQRAGREAKGIVVFARGQVPAWVTPMWSLHGFFA